MTSCGFQVTGGLRLCHPLSAHLCAVALCDIFGGVTHPHRYSRDGCSGFAVNYINSPVSNHNFMNNDGYRHQDPSVVEK